MTHNWYYKGLIGQISEDGEDSKSETSVAVGIQTCGIVSVAPDNALRYLWLVPSFPQI
jgi:hypothetical protein